MGGYFCFFLFLTWNEKGSKFDPILGPRKTGHAEQDGQTTSKHGNFCVCVSQHGGCFPKRLLLPETLFSEMCASDSQHLHLADSH